MQTFHQHMEIQDEEELATGQATLLRLKSLIDKNDQFPVMGNSIAQIMQVTNGQGCSNKLAEIILQDQFLTSKVLSMVNSSSYGQFGGEVSTISRAVVILGLNQIQSLSLSIMIFEKLNNGPMAETLKSSSCQSFISAIFAKKLVEKIESIDSEEAFLVSMFNNLGKQITIYFLLDEYIAIEKLINEEKVDEEIASQKILGLNYSEIGQYIGMRWQLPINIINGIQPKPDAMSQRPQAAKDWLAQLSWLTNEIVRAVAHEDISIAEQELNNIIERYSASFSMDYEKVIQMLTVLAEILNNYCNILGINTDKDDFCKRFINFVQQHNEQETDPVT